SAMWTAWPPVVLLVSERWLVDCVASRNLLDPNPYDVRQRLQHPGKQVAKRRQQQTLKQRDGGGKSTRRFATAYDSDDNEYGSIEDGGEHHGRLRARGPPTVGPGPALEAVLKSAEAAETRTRQRQNEWVGSFLVRQWIPPRLGKRGLPRLPPVGTAPAAAVVVDEAPQSLGWWDPTHGSFVRVPDHFG
ncbi:hypothetical protein Vretimale_10519, partial [Volvox reticuliferus]